MKEHIEEAKRTTESINLHLVSQKTLYLQELLLDEMHLICLRWHKAVKNQPGAQKMSNSNVMRVVLELILPFLMVLDDVTNEESLKENLDQILRLYYSV